MSNRVWLQLPVAEARTSHGTGFARILAEFSSRYELDTSVMDMLDDAGGKAGPSDGKGRGRC